MQLSVRVLFLFYFLLSACSTGPVRREIPAADFFKNAERTEFRISPDGEYISFLQPYENRLNIFVQHLETNEITRVTAETERAVTEYYWAGNNQLVYLRDHEGDERYDLYAVRKDGTCTENITPGAGVNVRLIDVRDDGNVLLTMNKRDRKLYDAYRLNLETWDLHLIAKNPGSITRWVADHQGKLLLAVKTDGVTEQLLYRTTEDHPFKIVSHLGINERLIPQCFSFDNPNHIYALSNICRDKMALVEVDLETGEEIRCIYSNEEVDVTHVGYSPMLKRLLWAGFTTWKYDSHFLDESYHCFYANIEDKLPGKNLLPVGMDKQEEKILLQTYSDKNPGTYYLYDTRSDNLTKLSDVAPWLQEDEMADMKPIKFFARDSLALQGYLTLPKGKAEKQLPLVVVAHQGANPWERDSWGYNPEVQFLANRGYAVLQVNFRGTEGYGKRFVKASFKEWGRKMQDDIADGVEWLIKEGIADSTRIGIYGKSFGGYCALMNTIRNPTLYKCGVSYGGMVNLFTYLKDIPPYYKAMQGMLYAVVGNPETEAEVLREGSPVFHTEQIKVPMLIAQGAKDPRVNVQETGRLVHLLQKQGLEVTYILKPNEGGTFARPENSLEFYKALEAFLLKNLE